MKPFRVEVSASASAHCTQMVVVRSGKCNHKHSVVAFISQATQSDRIGLVEPEDDCTLDDSPPNSSCMATLFVNNVPCKAEVGQVLQ